MKQTDAMVYPLVAVDEEDFEAYARKFVAAKFPNHEYQDIVRQQLTNRGRAVLLQVRMTRKEEA